MLKILHIVLAVWIASPGCLCPLLQAFDSGHHHHASCDGHSTVPCSVPAEDCQDAPASCDHPEPDTLFLASESAAAGASGWNLLLVTTDYEFHSVPQATEARILPRAPPPTSSPLAGRSARVTYCSFLV